MNHKQLRKQLSDMGINRAQAEAGTSEGYPAIWLRWNGTEAVYTGHHWSDREMVENLYTAYKDEHLD